MICHWGPFRLIVLKVHSALFNGSFACPSYQSASSSSVIGSKKLGRMWPRLTARPIGRLLSTRLAIIAAIIFCFVLRQFALQAQGLLLTARSWLHPFQADLLHFITTNIRPATEFGFIPRISRLWGPFGAQPQKSNMSSCAATPGTNTSGGPQRTIGLPFPLYQHTMIKNRFGSLRAASPSAIFSP